ncbi:hypothetical protein HDU96_000775 [Phlyctochytrium bullatum]|nr:hypothetical protein HDU96_000775 [Phlyctochytrium bullatum]
MTFSSAANGGGPHHPSGVNVTLADLMAFLQYAAAAEDADPASSSPAATLSRRASTSTRATSLHRRPSHAQLLAAVAAAATAPPSASGSSSLRPRPSVSSVASSARMSVRARSNSRGRRLTQVPGTASRRATTVAAGPAAPAVIPPQQDPTPQPPSQAELLLAAWMRDYYGEESEFFRDPVPAATPATVPADTASLHPSLADLASPFNINMDMQPTTSSSGSVSAASAPAPAPRRSLSLSRSAYAASSVGDDDPEALKRRASRARRRAESIHKSRRRETTAPAVAAEVATGAAGLQAGMWNPLPAEKENKETSRGLAAVDPYAPQPTMNVFDPTTAPAPEPAPVTFLDTATAWLSSCLPFLAPSPVDDVSTAPGFRALTYPYTPTWAWVAPSDARYVGGRLWSGRTLTDAEKRIRRTLPPTVDLEAFAAKVERRAALAPGLAEVEADLPPVRLTLTPRMVRGGVGIVFEEDVRRRLVAEQGVAARAEMVGWMSNSAAFPWAAHAAGERKNRTRRDRVERSRWDDEVEDEETEVVAQAAPAPALAPAAVAVASSMSVGPASSVADSATAAAVQVSRSGSGSSGGSPSRQPRPAALDIPATAAQPAAAPISDPYMAVLQSADRDTPVAPPRSVVPPPPASPPGSPNARTPTSATVFVPASPPRQDLPVPLPAGTSPRRSPSASSGGANTLVGGASPTSTPTPTPTAGKGWGRVGAFGGAPVGGWVWVNGEEMMKRVDEEEDEEEEGEYAGGDYDYEEVKV